MSDPDDEAIQPDAVSGPGEPDGDDPAPPARPSRRPFWAMVAGLAACWFTLFGPLLAFVLAPLAIFLGRRALRQVDEEGGTPGERRQARIGFIAGIVAVGLIVLQVVLFQLYFEWEKDVAPVEPRSGAVEETEPAGGD